MIDIWAGFSLMNNKVMNISIQVFMWTYVFISLVYTPRSEIAGSYGKFIFNLLKKWSTIYFSK